MLAVTDGAAVAAGAVTAAVDAGAVASAGLAVASAVVDAGPAAEAAALVLVGLAVVDVAVADWLRGFEGVRVPVDAVLRFVVLAVLPVSSSVTTLSPFCVSQPFQKYTTEDLKCIGRSVRPRPKDHEY